MAFCTALFIALLNMTRLSSCCATLSANNFASKSGFLISCILRVTGMPILWVMSSLILSISSPFLPITIPGLAVWIRTLALSAVLSISILLTEACASFLVRCSLTSISLRRFSVYLDFSAYQLEVCFVVIPNLKPVGCTFCPIIFLFPPK